MRNLNAKRLKEYEKPQYYDGPTYEGTYLVYLRNRDSDLATQSNYDTILTILQRDASHDHAVDCAYKGKENNPRTVFDIRDSHYSVGWTETIYVCKCDKKAVQEAGELLAELDTRPVLDEDDLAKREQAVKNAEELESLQELKEAHDGYNGIAVQLRYLARVIPYGDARKEKADLYAEAIEKLLDGDIVGDLEREL